MLDRDQVVATMRKSLSIPAQWRDLAARIPSAATADSVMIACVAEHRLRCVLAQMTDDDAMAVCSLGPSVGAQQLVWRSFLLGYRASAREGEPTEPLDAAGLNADSTISDLAMANETATGRH